MASPQARHAGAIAQATSLPEANGTGSQGLKLVAIKAGSTAPDVSVGRPAGPRMYKSRLFARNHPELGFQARASPAPSEHEQRLHPFARQPLKLRVHAAASLLFELADLYGP